MRTNTFILFIFLLLSASIYGQSSKVQNIQGSWKGRIVTTDHLKQGRLNIDIENDNVIGSMEFPYQEDIPIEKVWIIHDSIFADFSNSLGAGTIYKGQIMPDSVIDGLWIQNGNSFTLRLRSEKSKGTNLNPKIDGFRIVKLIESTPLRFQQNTQTCWSYAVTSFIETEAIRLLKSPLILSPMFFVAPTYIEKAEKYVRMDGTSWFGEGDLTFSAIKAYKENGAIPDLVYSGKIDANSALDHNKMNHDLLDKVNYYVKSGRGDMTIEGNRKEIAEILSNTMGEAPDTFMYNQKKYTPKLFAKEMIGINPDDYFEITSFNHHPFYSKFILEIQANWNNNYYINLPIDDFSNVVDYALLNNFSVCWDGDIYDGFRNGFAVLSDNSKIITQQMRQAAFDNHTTEDHHNMHIIGIAENDNGDRFYIIKDSGVSGYLYMSKEYLLLKTISVMVNKSAIPKEITDKLNFVL